MSREVLMNASIYSGIGVFPRLLCVSRWIDMYVLVGRWQLF